MVILRNEFQKGNVGRMKEIYQSVGWNKHTEEMIETVFSASSHTIFAYIDGELVGFARSMSDGVFNAAIYDVIVHSFHQGKGIAKKIIDELLKQLQDVSCIHLISTTGNEEFYGKCGFKKLKTGMARYINMNLSKEYVI